ncbi:MAG TPA: hypothetical protein EYG75_07065 [Campylobacterales bacterium]|nr:hypothetical protein [Campylobacterales bacterium]
METFSLSIADISNNSDPKYFERGFAYFKKQAVIKLDFKRYDAKTMAIRSEVEGSSENIYHQSIFINVRESGMVDIDGDCSCPVGFNCKHIVAVLLQYIENEKNRYSPSQKRGVQWLKDFSKLSSTEEHVQYPEFLLYRLFEQGTYKIQELNFYRAKTLKKGAVSKGTRLRNLLHETYKHDFVDSDDLSIIQLLKALVNTTWSEEVTLEGEVGLMVLKKMVKSGRCYYRDAIEPLTFCKEILNVEFFWEEVETQKRKIVSNLNPEGTFILTSPPMYIDPIKNTLQVVHSKFDATSIDLLLQAPVVEVEDINQFMNKAFEIIPDVDIPIPKEFD